MVDLSGGLDGPYEHGFSNTVFIIPGIVFFGLAALFGYKLYKSLMERKRKQEEKRKLKQQKQKKK